MITHSLPTSEVSGSNPGPYVRKLVLTDGRQFTVMNLEQLFVLVCSAHNLSSLESDVKPQVNKYMTGVLK